MDKKVFILILNWNGWQDTIECVHSCENLIYPNFTIMVIDNGSEDESLQQLQAALPSHEIIATGENLGFAGGNNVGIRHALEKGADYIWLLNNDTTVDPAALTELVKTAEDDEQTGIVGSKILTYTDPDTLHFAGGKVNLNTGETKHLGAWEKDERQFDDIKEVDYVTGCSLLVKRAVIEKIGLMPEEYFLYYEETDWCLSARNAGFIVRMTPNSKVFHKISTSIDYFSTKKLYYLIRNRLIFLQKDGEDRKWFQRVLTDMRHAFFLIRTARFREAGMILKAYGHWLSKRTGPLT